MDDFPPIKDLNPEPTFERLPGESPLDYTQRIRISTVEKLTKTAMPEDPKDINALSQLLDSIDRQEFTKVKVEIDSQGASADKDALNLITAIVNAVGNVNPYLVETPVMRDVTHTGPVIEGVVLVPGELDTRPEKLTYDGFMKEYKSKNPKNTDDDDD